MCVTESVCVCVCEWVLLFIIKMFGIVHVWMNVIVALFLLVLTQVFLIFLHVCFFFSFYQLWFILWKKKWTKWLQMKRLHILRFLTDAACLFPKLHTFFQITRFSKLHMFFQNYTSFFPNYTCFFLKITHLSCCCYTRKFGQVNRSADTSKRFSFSRKRRHASTSQTNFRRSCITTD